MTGGLDAFFARTRAGGLDDIRLMAVTWAIYPLMHGYLLAKRGQTIGKRVVGIRIVRSDFGAVGFGRLMVLRWLSIDAISLLQALGNWIYLVDVVFIFNQSRKCLHDYLADTVVVRCRPGGAVDADGVPPIGRSSGS